eukprot:6956673-Heterocapsa_arctica.AAC.1
MGREAGSPEYFTQNVMRKAVEGDFKVKKNERTISFSAGYLHTGSVDFQNIVQNFAPGDEAILEE